MKNLKLILGSVFCFVAFVSIFGLAGTLNTFLHQTRWTVTPGPVFITLTTVCISGLLILGLLWGGLALIKSAGANYALRVLTIIFAITLALVALFLVDGLYLGLVKKTGQGVYDLILTRDQVADYSSKNILLSRPIKVDQIIGVFWLLEVLGSLILFISALRQFRHERRINPKKKAEPVLPVYPDE